MDSKQAPPPYSEATTDPSNGSQNAGYIPPAGDQGSAQTPYPPAAGYPPGYNQTPVGFGQGPTGYSQPPGGYAAPPAAGYYPPQGQQAGYNYQQTVVVNQPGLGGNPMAVAAVPDHMGLAIFTTICCCWPLGLVAIMRAQESRRALVRGDLRAASTYSLEARRYSMWAIAGGSISIVITVVIIAVYVSSATYY